MKVLVTADVAIDFLGIDSARILATPWLIAFMEMTARNLVKPHLEVGDDTVGTEVSVKHLAATPMGMQVTFRAELLEAVGRRLKFRIEAYDERQKVAEGTHERAIINVARFAERLRSQAQ